MTKNSTRTAQNGRKPARKTRRKEAKGKPFSSEYQPSPEAKSNGHLLKRIKEQKAREIMKAIDKELSGKKMASF